VITERGICRNPWCPDYAMMAFTANSEQEAAEMVGRVRMIAQGNVRDVIDLYRTTQALVLVIVLQCNLPPLSL
jgi:hypothetical protein